MSYICPQCGKVLSSSPKRIRRHKAKRCGITVYRSQMDYLVRMLRHLNRQAPQAVRPTKEDRNEIEREAR